MAKLVGPLKLRGSIDDLCCRKTEDGIVVGMKPGPSREKVLTHDNFKRTRCNASEFQLAIKSATLLRRALGSALNGVRATKLSGRMNGLLYSVAEQDQEHDLGYRCAGSGDVSRLEGFEFNHKLSLDYALPVCIEQQLDAASGSVQVNIPSFIVRRRKGFPPEATHFKILSCVGMMDFDKRRYSNHIEESDLLPLSKKMAAVELLHQLNTQPGEVMVHAVGMLFYKVVKGKEVLLNGGALQVMEAVRVAKVEQAVQLPAAIVSSACPVETDDFSIGITDALGVPLQDEAVRQLVREKAKGPRKKTRLNRYLYHQRITKG